MSDGDSVVNGSGTLDELSISSRPATEVLDFFQEMKGVLSSRHYRSSSKTSAPARRQGPGSGEAAQVRATSLGVSKFARIARADGRLAVAMDPQRHRTPRPRKTISRRQRPFWRSSGGIVPYKAVVLLLRL